MISTSALGPLMYGAICSLLVCDRPKIPYYQLSQVLLVASTSAFSALEHLVLLFTSCVSPWSMFMDYDGSVFAWIGCCFV